MRHFRADFGDTRAVDLRYESGRGLRALQDASRGSGLRESAPGLGVRAVLCRFVALANADNSTLGFLAARWGQRALPFVLSHLDKADGLWRWLFRLDFCRFLALLSLDSNLKKAMQGTLGLYEKGGTNSPDLFARRSAHSRNFH